MTKNNLKELNNHLFETLERLNDDELMAQQGELEIARSAAITNVAGMVVNTADVALRAEKLKLDYGIKETNIKMLEV